MDGRGIEARTCLHLGLMSKRMTGSAPIDIVGRQALDAAAIDEAHCEMLFESLKLGADPAIVNAQIVLLQLAAERRLADAAERLHVQTQEWLSAVRDRWCPELSLT